ncbi:MAG: type I 3-dehydroquinate dehydratase [Eubacteriales bacterium]|nr:type I 3-dehydroquinate dehydratase [Eubacteriales bacterium]
MLTVRNVVFGLGMPKICIPMTATDEKGLSEEARLFLTLDADLAEWRADFFQKAEDIGQVVETLKTIRSIIKDIPLLFTFRSIKEGGNKPMTSEQYFALNRTIIESGQVDLVDLEMENDKGKIKELIADAHRMDVKVILSSHNFEKTPAKEDIIKELKKMQAIGADMSKIAVMAQKESDVLRLLDASDTMRENYANRPFITISMGQIGTISRISGQLFGSAVTYASGKKPSAPGQLDSKDLRNILRILNPQQSALPGRIILIGYMGSGKTTIGRQLSHKIGYHFVDTDEVIEQREGIPICQIFDLKGESYFRELETHLLEEISKQHCIVVSCGGGIISQKNNVKILEKEESVVFLKDNITTLFERVKNDPKRPLASLGREEGKQYQQFKELYESRLPNYDRVANISVNGDGKTISLLIEEILCKCNKLLTKKGDQ